MLFYVWFPHKTRSKYFHKKANKQKTLQEIYFLFQLPKTQTTHSKRDVKKYKKKHPDVHSWKTAEMECRELGAQAVSNV